MGSHVGPAASQWALSSFQYTFPLVSARSPDPGTITRYGLSLAGDSVVLHTSEELDRRGAFKKLSVALALLGVYEGMGIIEPGGSGAFRVTPSPEEFVECSYPVELMETVHRLEQANDPYQIQACFTLSRGLALTADPEGSIIEFFRLIELYIKHLAWTGAFDPASAENVLVHKLILSKRVKDALKSRKILAPETVDLIYKMKEVRNKFISHGGMRPMLSELFGDPEDYRKVLEHSAFKYDQHLYYGAGFFERVLNDVSMAAAFLFTKLQGIEPAIFVRAGCSSQSSPHVQDVLASEGVRWIGPDAPKIVQARASSQGLQ